MLEDGTKAAEAMGILMRGVPPLGVLENTAEVHNLVVCTLCSCYPRAVLGYPPYGTNRRRFGRGRSVIRGSCWLRSGRRSFRIQSSCLWWIPQRIIAGWCCRCVRRARMAGMREVGWDRAGRRYGGGDGSGGGGLIIAPFVNVGSVGNSAADQSEAGIGGRLDLWGRRVGRGFETKPRMIRREMKILARARQSTSSRPSTAWKINGYSQKLPLL